jgi:hypothetical protein
VTRIISLFKNQMEAEQAVNALAAASLEDTSLYTGDASAQRWLWSVDRNSAAYHNGAT